MTFVSKHVCFVIFPNQSLLKNQDLTQNLRHRYATTNVYAMLCVKTVNQASPSRPQSQATISPPLRLIPPKLHFPLPQIQAAFVGGFPSLTWSTKAWTPAKLLSPLVVVVSRAGSAFLPTGVMPLMASTASMAGPSEKKSTSTNVGARPPYSDLHVFREVPSDPTVVVPGLLVVVILSTFGV